MSDTKLNFDPTRLVGSSSMQGSPEGWKYTVRHSTLGIEGHGDSDEAALDDMAAKVKASGREIVIPAIGGSAREHMELGNILFGNSRGAYAVPRAVGYEDEMLRLFDACGDTDGRGEPFENDTFVVRRYFWGDCECDGECSCPAGLPNFHHKPTDFRLDWYKYPLRDSYANQPLTIHEFAAIIDDCIASLSSLPPHSEGE